MQNATTNTSEIPDSPPPAPRLTRQQRRHAQQAKDYQEAIAKQKTRYVIGIGRTQKNRPHIGIKQMSKMLAKQLFCL